MKLNFQKTCLLKDNDILNIGKTLLPYVEKLRQVLSEQHYSIAEGSINLPFDKKILNSVTKVVKQKQNSHLKYIIDIGIGGSNLGTKAIYDALFGYFDVLDPDRFPKIIFADTNDPEFNQKLINLLKKIKSRDEVIINAISKSGGTTETIANLEIVLAVLNKKFGNVNDQLVITTDENSNLFKLAKQNHISLLTLPKTTGGRYSVFSAVGLFPLLLAGININKLRSGAQQMVKDCLNKDVINNPAIISAVILFLHNQKSLNINDNFYFHPELESIGKWYRQLMGESIGKEGKGITPTVSIGSTDLHSMGQLYFGGPKDKITTFIYSQKNNGDVSLPKKIGFDLVKNINGIKMSNIMDAIYTGTKIATHNQKLPYMEIILDDLTEKSIGEYLQFKMIEMMFLGKLLNVNTFDQPHVELYKTETKRILAGINQ